MDALGSTLAYLGDPQYWAVFAIGIGLASALGLIPGVGSTLVIGIAIPLVVFGIDDPAIGIVLLAAITGTGNTFDSIPAQLMGIVGAGTQVTFLEGHQLARQGKGAFSLGAVYAVSAIGGLVGAFLLLLAIPIIRPLILQVSFGEIAMLALFGILMVSVMSHGAMIKGLLSGLVGLLLGTVGIQAFSGVDRFTFGVYDLQTGLPIVATILGLMALPEMIDLTMSRSPVSAGRDEVATRDVFAGMRYGCSRWKLALRHSVIGTVFGAIPGTGASVVTWLSYGIGIAFSKDRTQFGKGSLDGLLFAESAENAKEGGQAIPTLALGVPGSTSWALVLVGMLAYGIQPGPDMLSDHGEIVGLIVLTLALANLVLTLVAPLITKQLMRLTTIPYPAIGAVVIPITVMGAYFSDFLAVTFAVIVVFTLLGLLMKSFGWPRPPMVLAFILGPVVEDNLFTAVSINGAVGVALRPLTIALFLIVVATVVFLHVAMNRVSAEVEELVVTADGSEELELLVEQGAQFVTGHGGHDEPAEHGTGQLAAGAASEGRTGDVSTSVPTPTPESSRPWETALVGRVLRPDQLVTAGFLAIGLYAFITASGYDSSRGSMLPQLAGGAIVVLAAFQSIRKLRHPDHVQGQIMDLGMRTKGETGALQAGLIVGILVTAYFVAIPLIGLQYAGYAFALLTPLILMRGRARYYVPVISVFLVWLFTVFVGDELLHALWPGSLIQF